MEFPGLSNWREEQREWIDAILARGNAYFVGGCVRDEVLGKPYKDVDLIVTGIPLKRLQDLLDTFGKTVFTDVGDNFGVIKFTPREWTEDEPIDVALPRTEIKHGEGHTGFEVNVDHNLPVEKDLERRDLTINSIAVNIKNMEVVDPFGGYKDIQQQRIKMTNPQAFKDDPLRMLRAVQFAARFGFMIETETFMMMRKNKESISKITGERIMMELEKIVKKGSTLIGEEVLKKTGLMKEIFGHDNPVSSKNVKTLPEWVFILAPDDPISFWKKKLKGDNDGEADLVSLKIGSQWHGDDLKEARMIASQILSKSPRTYRSKFFNETLREALQEMVDGKYPKNLNEMDITGDELELMGFQKGPLFGDIKRSVFQNILMDVLKNKNEDIRKFIITNYGKKLP